MVTINAKLVKQIITGSLSGKITFPEIITTLSNEGFESYHIDYLRGDSRYYHRNGESLLEKIEYSFPSVSEKFSPERVQAAISRSQAGIANYSDFIKDTASAGCAYYIVYLNGKKVRYFGRNGDEHTEHFPGIN